MFEYKADLSSRMLFFFFSLCHKQALDWEKGKEHLKILDMTKIIFVDKIVKVLRPISSYSNHQMLRKEERGIEIFRKHVS